MIDEDDLHGYVDDQLDSVKRLTVERYLHSNPDVAQRVAAYRVQRAALRSAYDSPVIAHLTVERRPTRPTDGRRRFRRIQWEVAAAIVLAFGVGAAEGWFLHAPAPWDRRPESAVALLGQQALASHAVYAADQRHPIEVSGAALDDLQQWLSNRLGSQLFPPNLSTLGYKLIGGRLLATERGNPAALFMYDDARLRRLSVVIRPMMSRSHAPQFDMSQNTMNGCGWIENGVGYAVVAEMSDSELDRVAKQIKAEVSKHGT